MGDRKGQILAVAGLAVAFFAVLASTGPSPSLEVAGTVRREGGVCLQLERWSLLGWAVVGQTHTVSDVQNGVWHEAQEDPPCADVTQRLYLVRSPFDGPTGVYRVCGIADADPCVEFSRVPFESTRGIQVRTVVSTPP
jgi:hypothetical protein